MISSGNTLSATRNNDNDDDMDETLDVVDPIKETAGRGSTSLRLSRRGLFWRMTIAATSSIAVTTLPGFDTTNRSAALAAVTDETQTFGGVAFWNKDEISKIPSSTSSSTLLPQSSTSKESDEVSIFVSIQDMVTAASLDGGLGIELGDIAFRDNQRVYVKSIRPKSLASRLGIQKDWIVVAIDGQSTERTNAQGVAILLSRAIEKKQSSNKDDSETIEIRFRDPSLFRQQLQNLGSSEAGNNSGDNAVVSTQLAPGGTVKKRFGVTEQQADQTISVSQLIPPKMCKRGGAQLDDLLEISYLGTVVETGQVFDGSAILINGQGIPGRGNDVSLYFVLGKQPMGQFPPGWDVGMVGQCVGERRRILIPPVLAYGATGMPRRGIPPDATLQYDITLVSINGLSTPQ
jgi:FK506-binding protein 2